MHKCKSVTLGWRYVWSKFVLALLGCPVFLYDILHLPLFLFSSLPIANSLRNRRPQMMRPTGTHSSYLVLRGQTLDLECIVQGLWVSICTHIFILKRNTALILTMPHIFYLVSHQAHSLCPMGEKGRAAVRVSYVQREFRPAAAFHQHLRTGWRGIPVHS